MFASGLGFPRDCGPSKATSHQWQSATRGGQSDWAWFVDLSTTQVSQSSLNENVCTSDQCTTTSLDFSIISGNFGNTFLFPNIATDTFVRKYIGRCPVCVGTGNAGTHASTYSGFKKECSSEPACTGFTFTSNISPSDEAKGTGALKSCLINGKKSEFGGEESSGSFDYWEKSSPTAGQLTVFDSSALNREKRKRFALRVRVRDSGLGGFGQNILSASAIFAIDIQNVNEAPFFIGCDTPVKLFVNEHRQNVACHTDRRVGRIRANDVDKRWGDSLSMSIQPAGAPFTINAQGIVRTSDAQCEMIDYEKTKVWNINVIATDTAGLTASCDVTIHVRDLNEHPILSRKSTSVANSLDLGTPFGKPVNAVDVDSNQKHSYYIVGGNGRNYIGIQKETGRLFVKNDMSSITSSKKQILVRVHDDGRGKLMAQNWVDVNIINTNQPPTMDASFLRSFPENSMQRALIGLPIVANDPDGDNNKIKFHKISGDTNNCFSVDNFGGQVRLRNTKKLCNDYESRLGKPWSVSITAVDGGAGALTASTIVSIVVTDVNEAPQWSNYQKTKHFYVYESAAVGATILSGAFALEPDIGSLITYSITGYQPQDGASMFQMQDTSDIKNIISLQSYSAELNGLTEFVSGVSSNRQALGPASGLVGLELYTNLHLMWNHASFHELSGLSGEGERKEISDTLVSYESVTYAGYYLSHNGATLSLQQRSNGGSDFDASATFIKHNALGSAGGDLSLSFECANKLGYYWMRDLYTGNIRVVSRVAELQSSDVYNNAATWYRKPGLALGGTYGGLLLLRPLDYESGPRKFRLTLRATDSGETGCQNVVNNHQLAGTLLAGTALTTSNVWECCAGCGRHAYCQSYTYNKVTGACQFFKEMLVRPACYPACTGSTMYSSGSPMPVLPYVKPLFTSSFIYIHVLDVNEPPNGASKEFNVPEDAKTGAIVGTVTGKDSDKNQIVKYAIHRENCFEVTTSRTKAYKQLPPVYQGKRSSTAHLRVKSTGSVHVLLARASTAVEIIFGTKHEIRYCKKYTPSPIPTVDQCEIFATAANPSNIVSGSAYREYWISVDTDLRKVTAGSGPDKGAFESTILSAVINATLAPLRYAVTGGSFSNTHFAGVCLPVESEQDEGIFAVDRTSGVVRIRKPILDYEAREAYGIQMVLTDEGVGATPSLSSFSFVRINVIDVNEPPEFEGAAPGLAKTTSLLGCFYDKSTAVTPRLDPDPLRDLPTMPSISGTIYRDVFVGRSSTNSRTIRSQGVLDCRKTPVNRQHDSWRDQFQVEVEPAGGTITVVRQDSRWGWGQQLVLRCTATRKFDKGATKTTCDKSCSGFKYFGLQEQGECWCGNSYGKYGPVPGQCDAVGPFYGKNKNLIYRRGDESTSSKFSRTVRVYTKGNNGEMCGLRATPQVGIPLKTVGATGHLAIWDCSGKSDPLVATGTTFSTTIGTTQCHLRYSVVGKLADSEDSASAYWECAPNAVGDEMSFSSNKVVSSSSNLALGRPTTQSSVRHGGKASRGVDGNTNSKYGAGSCTHTAREKRPWWRVDLERVVDVSTVKITNRKDCCSKRITNTKIYVGTTSVLAEATECGEVKYSTTNPIEVQCASTINGRYVWIKKTTTGILTLCEVEVYASSTSAITAAPLQSNPFIYVKGVQTIDSIATTYCGLTRHKYEGTPASVVFGNQFPALFDCTGSAIPIQIGDEIPVTSELYYDDHNLDGSVKTEGWMDGSGASSVLGNSNALKTLTYGTSSLPITSCDGQAASCRQMHGPFASDTTKEISKEWRQLPPHTAIAVRARIWSIGSWDNEQVSIQTSNTALSTVKSSYQYIGCYQDKQNRDLKKQQGNHHNQKTCSAKCRGYTFFGMQNNGECWCGTSYGKYGQKSDSECNPQTNRGSWGRRRRRSSGGGCGTCLGAGWRNAVYRQTSSVDTEIKENWSGNRNWQNHDRGSQGSPWVHMTHPVYNPWSGGRGGAYYDHVNFVVDHTGPDFTLVVRTSINQRASDEYMGISDLQIYLETTETSTLYCGVADEHKEAPEIMCANDGVITSVVFASYGTATGTATVCSSYVAGSCHATHSKTIVEKDCVGKNKCTLSAANSIFGDPCRGTLKRLLVQYKCSPPKSVPSLQNLLGATTPQKIVSRSKPSSCPSDVNDDFIACMSVPETSREGIEVGTILASTAPGHMVYSLQTNSYGLFTIDSNGGSIALSSGVQPLDFETTARHELVVRVADSVSGLFRNGRVLIMVSDVNEVL